MSVPYCILVSDCCVIVDEPERVDKPWIAPGSDVENLKKEGKSCKEESVKTIQIHDATFNSWMRFHMFLTTVKQLRRKPLVEI